METASRKPTFQAQPVVFWTSAGIILASLVISVLATESVGDFFVSLQRSIVDTFGWFYIVSMTGFLIFVIYLMQSRFSNIRLGPDDSKPEFSTL